jgi:hypothetical protein
MALYLMTLDIGDEVGNPTILVLASVEGTFATARALRSRQREIVRRLLAEGRPWRGDNAVVSSDCRDGCKPTSLTVAPLPLEATNARPAIGRDERQYNSTFKGGIKRRPLV